MSTKANRIVFWSILAIVAATIAFTIWQGRLQPKATYSEFLKRVQAGEVTKATVEVAARSGVDQIDYTLKNGSRVKTVVPSDDREALAAMRDKLVNVEIRDASSSPYRPAGERKSLSPASGHLGGLVALQNPTAPLIPTGGAR